MIEKAYELINEMFDISSEEELIRHILNNKVLGYSAEVYSYIHIDDKLQRFLKKYKSVFLLPVFKEFLLLKNNWRDNHITNWEINGEIIEKDIVDSSLAEHLSGIQCIVIATMPNYLNSIIPVIDQMVVEGMDSSSICIVTNNKYLESVRERTHYSTIAIERIMSIYSFDKYTRFCKDASDKYNNSDYKRKLAKVLPGYSRGYLRKRFLYVLTEMIPETKAVLHAFNIIFTENNIKFVIGARKRRMVDNAIFEQAKIRGIPTYISVHGAIDASEENIPVGGMFDVDYIFSWGGAMDAVLEAKKKYLNVGTILSFGSPILNVVYDRFKTIKCSVELEKQHDFLFLSQPDYYKYSGTIVSYLGKEGVEVCIKPHPYDNRDSIISTISEKNVNYTILDGNSDTLLAIVNSKISCTVNSTCNLDVMVLQKPLITIGFGNNNYDLLHAMSKYNLPIAKDYKELLLIVKRLLYDKEYYGEVVQLQNRYLQDNYGDYRHAISNISAELFKNFS